MNGALFHGVARALTGLPKGKWVEVLPSVFWSIHTTVARPTGFTLFKLLYGSKAVTPEEEKLGSLRTSCPVGPGEVADFEEGLSRDLLEETRLQVVNNLQKYMASVEKSYNQKVRPREFALGDLVLKRHPNQMGVGKLQSKWQGPFIVSHSVRPGAYHLMELDGELLSHT